MEPPVIKCPNVKEKTAEPGQVTAKVTWDTPEGQDTAEGILTESVSISLCSKGLPIPFISHYIVHLGGE